MIDTAESLIYVFLFLSKLKFYFNDISEIQPRLEIRSIQFTKVGFVKLNQI